jgi:ATP-dependent Zn protease
MNRPITAFTSLALALCLALATLAGVAGAAEEGTIVYTHESEAQFQAQLAAKKVKSVIVNKRLRTLRVTLVDGTHVLASYPKHQEPQTVARLKASGIPVSVLAKAAAEKELKHKPVHHKIRYIVGGAVIAVIVIVGVVLLINRRRQRD